MRPTDDSSRCLQADAACADAGPDMPDGLHDPIKEGRQGEGEARRKSMDVMDSILDLDLGSGTEAAGGAQVLGKLCLGPLLC